MNAPTWAERSEAVTALALPMRDKCVLQRMAWHAYESWPECWPSQPTLAKECGCGLSSVERAIASLKAKGYVVQVRRRKRDSTVYRLRIPGLQDPSDWRIKNQDPSNRRARPVRLTAKRRTERTSVEQDESSSPDDPWWSDYRDGGQ